MTKVSYISMVMVFLTTSVVTIYIALFVAKMWSAESIAFFSLGFSLLFPMLIIDHKKVLKQLSE